MDVLGVLDGQEPGDRERLPVQNNKHKLVLGLTLPKRCDSRQAFHNILLYLLHESPLCSPGPVVTCELPFTIPPCLCRRQQRHAISRTRVCAFILLCAAHHSYSQILSPKSSA